MACGTPALGLAVAGACDALADGELGAAVAEDAFPAALKAALKSRGPKGETLAQAVQQRFGRPAFEAAARDFMERLAA
jgi:phosphatidylinositol alpha-1,6-mannosyltransferase